MTAFRPFALTLATLAAAPVVSRNIDPEVIGKAKAQTSGSTEKAS